MHLYKNTNKRQYSSFRRSQPPHRGGGCEDWIELIERPRDLAQLQRSAGSHNISTIHQMPASLKHPYGWRTHVSMCDGTSIREI
jgi:hypothetical protein